MTQKLHLSTLLFGLAVLMLVPLAHAQPPETSDPDFRLKENFDQPGTFPTTVNAANIDLTPMSGAELDGSGEDIIKAGFPAAGPLKWTSSRINSGDLALSIGPAFPDNPLSYPGDAFLDNFQAMNSNFDVIDENTNDLTTLAWRVNSQTGALLATTRHNGVDDGYVITAGNPVGTMKGVAYFTTDFGQGWGFRPNDGIFGNGGNGSSDLVMGHAGDGTGFHEAVFDVSATYLPYEQGWQGAWVNGAESGEATFSSGAPGLATSTVNWTAGQASVLLPDVDSASDGMLFVSPANGSSTTRIASAYPNSSGGWTTTARLDDDADTTGATYLDFDGNDFQFVYVPYDATNLIGAHVDGADGSAINSAGDASFNLVRNSSGKYSLSVFEDDGTTKKTGDSGTLILSVADTLGGTSTLGSRAFMSYEYDSASGDFLIESNELVDTSSDTPFDNFGNEFAGSDSDFYFAWIDFTNPLSLGVPADLNNDGFVDGLDLGILLGNFDQSGIPASGGELNGTDPVDGLDLGILLGAWNPPEGLAAASVPEPASAVLLIGMSVALLSRRRA